MFTSFKERLNSAVQTIAEADRYNADGSALGREVTASPKLPEGAAESAALASPGQSLSPNPSPLIAGKDMAKKEGSPTPSTAKSANEGSDSAEKTVDASGKASDASTAKPTETTATSEAELPRTVIDKLEKLKKYEARFPELAKAYKQLAKEKKAAEEILREVTPLEGLSDLDAFEAHLRSLKARSEMSTDEIRRLAELKTVTDKEVEELKEQVARERRTSKGEINKLQEQLLIKTEPVQVKNEGVMTQADEDVEGKVHVIPPVEVESTMVQTDAVDQEEKAEEKAPVASPSAIDGPLDTLRTLFTADTPEEEDLAKAYSSLGELLKIKKDDQADKDLVEAVNAKAKALSIPTNPLSTPVSLLKEIVTSLEKAKGSDAGIETKLKEAEERVATLTREQKVREGKGGEKRLVADLRGQIKKAETKAKVSATALESIKSQRDALEKEKVELARQVAEASSSTPQVDEAALEEVKKRAAEERASLEADLLRAKAEADEKVAALEEDLAHVREGLEGMKGELTSSTSQARADGEAKVKEVTGKLEEAIATIASLEDRAGKATESHKQEVDALTAKATEEEDQRKEMTIIMEKVMAEKKKAEKEVEMAGLGTKKTDERVKTLEAEVTSLIKRGEEDAERMTKLLAVVRSGKVQVETLEAERRKQDEKATTLEARTKEAESQVTSLMEKVETLEAEGKGHEEEKERLEKRCAEADGKVASLEEDVGRSRTVVSAKAAEADRLAGRVAELEGEVRGSTERAERERSRLEERSRGVAREAEVAGKALAEAQAELSRTQAERTAKEAELSERIARLERRLEVSEGELATEKEGREKDGSELGTLQGEVQGLRDALATASASRDELLEVQTKHEQQVEEARMREGHLRSLNKTLKEEVRKLAKQGGALPSAPPVSTGSAGGRATDRSNGAKEDPMSRVKSTASAGVAEGTISPEFSSSDLRISGSEGSGPSQEVIVNLEYLRNILVKFVEFKQQRPQLIVVLATLLKIPPEDVKRMVQQLS